MNKPILLHNQSPFINHMNITKMLLKIQLQFSIINKIGFVKQQYFIIDVGKFYIIRNVGWKQ